MSNKGILFIVSGPSGAGKGTVLKELLKLDDKLFYSVSATTRKARKGEADGINYYFVNKEQFKDMIQSDKLLEYTRYCGSYYGTPLEAVNKKLDEGFDVILEIEVKGAGHVKKKRPESVLVFIMPPSFKELTSRLKGRDTETEDKIKQRLKEAEAEMEKTTQYDFVVINDVAAEAARQLLDIIKMERLN